MLYDSDIVCWVTGLGLGPRALAKVLLGRGGGGSPHLQQPQIEGGMSFLVNSDLHYGAVETKTAPTPFAMR